MKAKESELQPKEAVDLATEENADAPLYEERDSREEA
jgi:hypothetical protein